jgi:hypothetical protein
MREYDVHYGQPTVDVALSLLDNALRLYKSSEKCIKIIHGYGSSGAGGAIRVAVRRALSEKQSKGIIKAYIPGEALIQPMGFADLIHRYKDLLQGDVDAKRGNDGITFVFFR